MADFVADFNLRLRKRFDAARAVILYAVNVAAKFFDAYCFSYLTDDLPVADNVIVGAKDLKAKDIVSFREFKTLEVKNEYYCGKKVDSERVPADCEIGLEKPEKVSKSRAD